MNDKDSIADVVKALVHLDIDATFAYEAALKKIDIAEVHAQIAGFMADHERHVRELSVALQGMGVEPPKRSADLKGKMLEGITALRSLTGTEGALKAMKSNEELTNRQYAEALTRDLPVALRTQIAANHEDEKRHLRYVVETLKARPWEAAGRPPSHGTRRDPHPSTESDSGAP